MRLLPEGREIDERALSRALDLAEDAAAFASPNPTVGCVLLRDDAILGEGAHLYDKRDHAEIVALNAATAAGNTARGATAFVTLEPCAHHGRTGPCADALLAAGIRRCVIATVDPNPLVREQGIAKLRAAGVQVDLLDPTHPLAIRARRLDDAFAFAIQHNRPFVSLKAAFSVDGYLAPPPSARSGAEPFWLTGPAARADVAHLRHTADALLTGIGTVLADNPQLTDRTGLPRRRPLLRIVLDSHLRTPPSCTLISQAEDDLLLVCDKEFWDENAGDQLVFDEPVSDKIADTAPSRRSALARRRLEILPVPALGSIEGLQAVLAHLHQRQIRSVLTEAGSALNGALLRAHLVDHVVLYIADRELGANAIPFAAGGPPLPLLQQQLTSVTRTAFPHGTTKDVRLTGYLHDPWHGF